MKNKLLKGFTLIELVVVIAIIGILTIGLLNMFKPIRTTFVDSTYYERQRTVQSGISQYIVESTRCATKLGIYSTSSPARTINGTSYNISDSASAIDAFCAQMNITPKTSSNEQYTSIHCITIDQVSLYSFKNKNYGGRIFMKRWNSDLATPGFDEYCALGHSYYGASTYSTSLTPSLGTTSVSLDITTATNDTIVTKTSDTTVLKNISNTPTKFDTQFFKDPSNPGYYSTGYAKTFIVYTNPD